jgi:hypothetical protein
MNMNKVESPIFTWIRWINASYALADIMIAESVLVGEIGEQEDLREAVACIADDLDRKLAELESTPSSN